MVDFIFKVGEPGKYDREILEPRREFNRLYFFRKEIRELLNDYPAVFVYAQLEKAITEKAEIDSGEFWKKNKAFLDNLNKHWEFVGEVKPMTDGNIAKLEASCNFVKHCLAANNLSHQERRYLLFLYSNFGEPGYNRLVEVMTKQQDYRPEKTAYQISYFKKSKTLIRVSCSTIRKQGLCGGCQNEN